MHKQHPHLNGQTVEIKNAVRSVPYNGNAQKKRRFSFCPPVKGFFFFHHCGTSVMNWSLFLGGRKLFTVSTIIICRLCNESENITGLGLWQISLKD